MILGPVEIHILKENQPVTGSPLTVHAFDPTAVYLINFPKKIQINTKTSFYINTTQAGKGSLKITIKGFFYIFSTLSYYLFLIFRFK
jgi:hypothetical protein